MDVDFVRFVPDERCQDFGFDNFVVFLENPKDLIKLSGFLKGYIVKAESGKELISKLRKAKRDWFVGVVGDLSVLRSAVMRWRVDIILDFEGRELEYGLVKMAKEKDVAIEISLSRFLRCSGFKRVRLFEQTLDLLRAIKKFDTPFVLTSGATDFYEMRPKRQIYEFFEFLSADVKRGQHWLKRLVRRYTDERYILDGLEIEV
jgi:ribonuclease P/MRP protein subunit RPP1